jgi:hypothetical protein
LASRCLSLPFVQIRSLGNHIYLAWKCKSHSFHSVPPTNLTFPYSRGKQLLSVCHLLDSGSQISLSLKDPCWCHLSQSK